MINFDDCPNQNKTQHNRNHSCRIVIIGGSASGKKSIIEFSRKQTGN